MESTDIRDKQRLSQARDEIKELKARLEDSRAENRAAVIDLDTVRTERDQLEGDISLSVTWSFKRFQSNRLVQNLIPGHRFL